MWCSKLPPLKPNCQEMGIWLHRAGWRNIFPLRATWIFMSFIGHTKFSNLKISLLYFVKLYFHVFNPPGIECPPSHHNTGSQQEAYVSCLYLNRHFLAQNFSYYYNSLVMYCYKKKVLDLLNFESHLPGHIKCTMFLTPAIVLGS